MRPLPSLRGPLAFAIALAAIATSPAPARAQDSPVKGLRIVVPDARGKGQDGRAALTKSVRRTMAEAVGPLIPSQKLAAAQKKLKHTGKKLTDPASLAEAARTIDAQYVVSIEITKEKWLFTARAIVVNVETGEIQMDFRSQYFKPKQEADDRGKRIGARTVLKIEELLKSNPPPFAGGTGAVASREKPGGAEKTGPEAGRGGTGRETSASNQTSMGGSSGGSSGPSGGSSGGSSGGGSSGGSGGSGGSGVSSGGSSGGSGGSGSSGSSAVASSGGSSGGSSTGGSSSLGGSSSSGGSSSGGSNTSAQMEISPEPTDLDEAPEFFRVNVAGGAGILRTYDLSAPGVDSSRLSYRLEPLAMIMGDAEFIIPGVGLAAMARVSWRPVKFRVTIAAGQPDDPANTPSGVFFDTVGLLRYHLAVSGEGLNAFKLIPGAGVRLGMTRVERQPGEVIVSSTAFSPILQLALRMPINDVLEIDIGVDGGLILGYSETPVNSGTKDSGFNFGGDLQARIWLSSAIAIAFDTRFDFESISFTGNSSRQTPNETLTNASITTKDLRTGIGIAFRL